MSWPRLHEPGVFAAQVVLRSLPQANDVSWRPVDIRVGMVAKCTLGDRFDAGKVLQVRPFDLTRENVALLCLRCWATPS